MYYVDTDASDVGLGAVLSQDQGGSEVIVAYASRALSKAERNYDVTRRELLAVVYALKTFKQYVLGQHFVLWTDHAALQWLRRTPEPLGQQARWLTFIEMFDFAVVHRAGTKHGNADSLSRRPSDQQDDSIAARGAVSMISPEAEEFVPRGTTVDDPVVGDLIDLSEDLATKEVQSRQFTDANDNARDIGPVAEQMVDMQLKDTDIWQILGWRLHQAERRLLSNFCQCQKRRRCYGDSVICWSCIMVYCTVERWAKVENVMFGNCLFLHAFVLNI